MNARHRRANPLRLAFALSLPLGLGTAMLLLGCALLLGLAAVLRLGPASVPASTLVLTLTALVWPLLITRRAIGGLRLLAHQRSPRLHALQAALLGGPMLLGPVVALLVAALLQLPIVATMHMLALNMLIAMLLVLAPQWLLPAAALAWLGAPLLRPAIQLPADGVDVLLLVLLVASAWRWALRPATPEHGWSAPLAASGRARSPLFAGRDAVHEWLSAAPGSAPALPLATALGAPFHYRGIGGLLRMLAPAAGVVALVSLFALSSSELGIGDLLYGLLIGSFMLAAAPAARLRALRRAPSAELAELSTLPGLTAARSPSAGLMQCLSITALLPQAALATPVLVMAAADGAGPALLVTYALVAACAAIGALAMALWALVHRRGDAGFVGAVALFGVFAVVAIVAMMLHALQPGSVAVVATRGLIALFGLVFGLFAVTGWRELRTRSQPFAVNDDAPVMTDTAARAHPA